MRISKILLTALALAALPAATLAAAQEWVRVTSDESDASWSYDRSRVIRDGDVVTVWIQADHSAEAGAEYRFSTHNLVLNCAARRYRRISTIRHRADGSVYNRYDEADPTFNPIGPETVLADMTDAVCALPR
jgi:flagellar basal body L-ring protein FlgH